VYVPEGHAVQTWSAVEVPALDTYVPTWQTIHGTQALALALEVNCPDGQAAHTRSLWDVPAVITYVPAAHALNGTHWAALVVVL
jgi:hypothetical protein